MVTPRRLIENTIFEWYQGILKLFLAMHGGILININVVNMINIEYSHNFCIMLIITCNLDYNKSKLPHFLVMPITTQTYWQLHMTAIPLTTLLLS